jgi:hypothetical protein
MSVRRYKGYSTDTKHGFFGTFTIWEAMSVLFAGIFGSGLTSDNGATPMIYGVVCAGSTLAVVLISRRLLSNYPKLFVHIYSYLNRPDYLHVTPERSYTPVLADARRREREHQSQRPTGRR